MIRRDEGDQQVDDGRQSEASSVDRNERIRQIVSSYLRSEEGGRTSLDDLVAAHPELMPQLGEELRKARLIVAARANVGDPDYESTHDMGEEQRTLNVRCPNCRDSVEVALLSTFVEIACSTCGSRFSLVDGGRGTRSQTTVTTVAHYELKEQVGCGGFGAVWKALDTELDRTVAVKIPHPGKLSALEAEKFLREARSAAQLNHPRIVGVHEVGRDGDTLYIVSDYIRGVSLAGWLTARRPGPREAARLCAKIADAVHHAHEAGVIHRDLKPANIMMDSEGDPHIMDFGLAKRDAGEVTLTTEGRILGTPGYMPPEQARGEGHAADRRSDVYSVGVVLYELLTGELPFRGSPEMVFYQVINDDPPSPRGLDRRLPRDLETITLKCLRKEPEKRFQTLAELKDELDRYLAGQPIQSRPVGSAARAWRWCERNPAVASLSAVILAVMVMAFVLIIGAWRKAEAASRQANEEWRAAAEAFRLLHNNVANSAHVVKTNDNIAKSAEEALRASLRRYDSLGIHDPGGVNDAAKAQLHNTLGVLYKNLERFEESIQQLSRATKLAAALVERQPSPNNRRLLAVCHVNMANTHREATMWEGGTDYDLPRELLRTASSILESIPVDAEKYQSLRDAVNENLARTYNLRAWSKATSPDVAIRDGQQAVRDAIEAVKLGTERHENYDTLAAAHAEAGDFERAIEAQRRALELVQQSRRRRLQAVDASRKEADREYEQLRDRLRLYETQRPYRADK